MGAVFVVDSYPLRGLLSPTCRLMFLLGGSGDLVTTHNCCEGLSAQIYVVAKSHEPPSRIRRPMGRVVSWSWPYYRVKQCSFVFYLPRLCMVDAAADFVESCNPEMPSHSCFEVPSVLPRV